MTQTEQIDTKAAKIAGTLADKLLTPFEDTLAQFEGAFPGITERLKSVVDIAKIKAAFTKEVGTSIKNLKEEGTEESLTAAIAKVKELRGLVEGSSVSSNEGIQTLINQAGGIFIGKDELVKLGKLSADAQIPEIPAKYSQAFLESKHPLRNGTMASHVLLAFDPESNQWHCIDRGEGSKSDIIPGSLGRDGQGLSGNKQDKLIENVSIEGVKISSPKDSYPVERILDNAIAKHLADGKSIDTAPFRGIWGRTADTDRALAGCRILLGYSYEFGSRVDDVFHSDCAYSDVGLLACWN